MVLPYRLLSIRQSREKTVYVEEASPEGVVTKALCEMNSTLVWSAPSPIGTQSASPVAITPSTLYLSGANHLQAPDVGTDKQLWEQQVMGEWGIAAGTRLVYVNGAAAICAYQVSDDSRVWCDAASPMEGFSPLLFMGETLYVGRHDGGNPEELGVEAWSAGTGELRWWQPGIDVWLSNFTGAGGVALPGGARRHLCGGWQHRPSVLVGQGHDQRL